MPCYHPIWAEQKRPGAELVWNSKTPNLLIPCSRCLGCKTDRATRWAHRCMHEAGLWQSNVFLTLTYDDEHLPPEGQLEPRHLQLFVKRLRRYTDRHPTNLVGDRRSSLRFLACGEYGTEGNRPHYHALLFNIGFPDQHKIGTDLYQSDLVSRLWDKGHNRIGQVTHASAAYVAQYSLKKQGRGDRVTADGVFIPGPFLRMSNRPAIGLTWLLKYAEDLRRGYLVEGTRKYPLPRYHKDKLKILRPALSQEITHALETAAAAIPLAQKLEHLKRLPDKERIHQARNQINNRRK